MRFNSSVFIAALAALASATPMSENNIRDDEASCTCGSDMLQRSFEKCIYYNVESSPSCQADEACVYEQTISCAEKNGCECPDLEPPASSTGTPTPTPSPTPVPTTLQIVTITAIPSSTP